MNHSKDVTISVVMTVYNGSKYLNEQLDSILNNLDSQDEILIGDDGSTDSSLSILARYESNDKRIKIYNNNHLGTTKNLEYLINIAKGDIIFISDQDDKWSDDKVFTVCEDFEKNPNIDLVFHNSKVSSASISEITKESLFEYLPPSSKFIGNLLFYHFWGCMFAFRKRAREYILPFRFEFDGWAMFCTSFFGRCYLEKATLMIYRRHGNNLSTFKRRNIMTVLKTHLSWMFIFYFFLPATIYKLIKNK